MALKCSVCGKFLARGTAHDRDRRADTRHYNPHPPTDGSSLEDENPIIVPPRRQARYRGSPHAPQSGPPSSERPGHGQPTYGDTQDEDETDNTRDRSQGDEGDDEQQSGPPSSERPGHGQPTYGDTQDEDETDNTRDRSQGDEGDDEQQSGPPSSERPGHGQPTYGDTQDEDETDNTRDRSQGDNSPDDDSGSLDSGIDRPRAKRKPPAADPGDDYDDAPPSTLSPLPPQYEDYSDPGEEQGPDWQAWRPAPITPQAPMLSYEEYSPDFGAPAPITPLLPDYGDLSEEYGEGTFDDTSTWWQSPESSLWLPQPHERDVVGGGLFATPEALSALSASMSHAP